MDIFDLALALTPRVGNKTIKTLINHFGSAENIFSQSYNSLINSIQLSQAAAKAIVNRVAFDAAQRQIEHCAKHNIRIIAASDDIYPDALRAIHDTPYIIYVMGNVELLSKNLISIVGTRKITAHGDQICQALVRQIGETIANPVIVSGLAFGTDSTAHRAAVANKIPTIAVVPTPLPTVAPTQHSNLAQSILEAGGAIVSEISINNPTNGKGYISRNRIIAGLSQTTIIIESTAKGGSMSTAEISISEGRPVGAIPGRITDINAEGCNRLIALKSAYLVSSAYDIIRELNWGDRVVDASSPKSTLSREAEPKEDATEEDAKLNEAEELVLRCFETNAPYHISELELASGLSAAKLGAALMMLELSDHILMVKGGKYERKIKL